MESPGNSSSAEECLKPVDVNCRTSNLQKKTDISVLRGRRRSSSCRRADSANEPREVHFQRKLCSGGCCGVRGTEEGKKYSKDRWIEFPPFPRALITMAEPERIPSSSSEV